MSGYALSKKADHDLLQIVRVSVREWGLERAERYVLDLHQTFERLAVFSDMGRRIDAIRPVLLQFESGSHVVFYRKAETGVLIMRVLHERTNFISRLRPDR